jgi:Zn-dependent protease
LTEWLADKLVILPAILIGLTFHEFAHGKVAALLGDPTPGEQGRLTLNPLPHIDWIGFFMLMFFSFGWAKPVMVSPWKFNRKIAMKTGMLLVSLAGPAMNFLLAFFSAVILRLISEFYGGSYGNIVLILLNMLWYNIILALFNLIPLPPLDGSKVLAGLLPDKGSRLIYSLEKYGPLLLMILIISNVFARYVLPVAHMIQDFILTAVMAL